MEEQFPVIDTVGASVIEVDHFRRTVRNDGGGFVLPEEVSTFSRRDVFAPGLQLQFPLVEFVDAPLPDVLDEHLDIRVIEQACGILARLRTHLDAFSRMGPGSIPCRFAVVLNDEAFFLLGKAGETEGMLAVLVEHQVILSHRIHLDVLLRHDQFEGGMGVRQEQAGTDGAHLQFEVEHIPPESEIPRSVVIRNQRLQD